MDAELARGLTSALSGACLASSALFGWLGIAVLAWGGGVAMFGLLRGALREESHARARLDLGKHLALALELLVARDVLDSVVAPTWDGLGKLAAIVALRTVIQVSLARELREVKVS